MDTAKRRTSADLVGAPLWIIGKAIWGPMLLTLGSQDQGASTTYIFSHIAGASGSIGFALAQRAASRFIGPFPLPARHS